MSTDEEQLRYDSCNYWIAVLFNEIFRYLEDATKIVREQAFYMKRAMVKLNEDFLPNRVIFLLFYYFRMVIL